MEWNEMRAYVWMRVELSQCADKDSQAAICQPGEWVIRGNLPGNVKIDPGNFKINLVWHCVTCYKHVFCMPVASAKWKRLVK